MKSKFKVGDIIWNKERHYSVEIRYLSNQFVVLKNVINEQEVVLNPFNLRKYVVSCKDGKENSCG